MKKFFGSLFIVVLALLVFVVVAKDWIIKTAIEQGVTRATGFATHVKSVKFSLPSTIHIQGLNIRNPQGFQEKNFVDIPEIYVAIDLGEALSGKRIHLPEVRLNLQEVHIEKNEKGVSNVELLSSMGGPGAKKQGAGKPSAPQPAKPAMPFLLEKLDLTVRNVSYEDRSAGASAAVIPGKKLAVDLNIQHEIFTNIADAKSVVNVILAKILNSAVLGKLLNIDPQALMSESLSGVVGSGKELLSGSTDLAAEQLSGLTQQAQNMIPDSEKVSEFTGASVDKAQALMGNTASAAKDKVSGLMGKLKASTGGDEEKPAE